MSAARDSRGYPSPYQDRFVCSYTPGNVIGATSSSLEKRQSSHLDICRLVSPYRTCRFGKAPRLLGSRRPKQVAQGNRERDFRPIWLLTTVCTQNKKQDELANVFNSSLYLLPIRAMSPSKCSRCNPAAIHISHVEHLLRGQQPPQPS